MFARTVAVAVVAAGLVGCGESVRPAPTPVEVSGTVTFADGRPVKDVNFILSPYGSGGLPMFAQLGANGTFTAKVAPGTYTFHFDAMTGKGAALKAIPESYLSPSQDHKVEVESGKSLDLKVGG